jgi:hypothetical protein
MYRPFLQPIKLEDFEDIVSSEEAFFLYLQNFDTSVDDLVSQLGRRNLRDTQLIS